MKTVLFSILLLACLASPAMSQRALSGTVSDADGDRLPGATVRVKGFNAGTTADPSGAFTLQLPARATTLIVSYTGFQTREVEVGDARVLDVRLESGGVIHEIVVTALGVTREEKSLGYAVAQVDGSDLDRVRDQNIVNQLAGRAAGVTVLGSSGGNLGGSARITIRGMRSLTGNNQPLFVVDGVPMDNSNFNNNPSHADTGGGGEVWQTERDYGNTIQDLNPDDIDDISILKGQAATALYGSRGANGVVMVTTKKGGSTQKGFGISINSSLTFDRISVYPKFQRRYGGGVDLFPRGYADGSGFYKTPYVELAAGGDTIGVYSSFDLVPIYAVDESSGTRFATSTDEHFQHLAGFTVDDNGTPQYVFYNGFGTNQPDLHFRDWNSWDNWDTEHFGKSRLWEVGDDPRKFFETGVTSSQSFAIDGGTGRSTFRVSYTRWDQKGIYPRSQLTRNTVSLNGSIDVTSRLRAFVGANYVNSAALGRTGTTYDFRGGFNPGQNFAQWWHTELRFADLKSYENPDGTMRTWNRQSADNPRPQYWDNPYWSRFKNYQNDGRDRVFGNAGLACRFNSWLSLTGRALTDFYSEHREERVATGSLLAGQYTQELFDVSEVNTDLILRAERGFSERFTASAFAGANKLWNKVARSFGATIGGLNVPGIYRLQNSVERPLVENSVTKKEIESLFGGLSLGWRSTVYLDLTGRQDWSSTLPEGANGYFYPSASVSYVFSENWKLPKMSFGKLRLGWAQTGSDTDPYNLGTTYTPNPNFGNLPSYTVPNTLNNARLKPEKTRSVEAGADVRFFHDRLGLDASVYQTNTTDQIIPLATAAGSGFEQQFVNAGEIQNRGLELSLNAVPVRSGRFSWEMTFNWGRNRNKLVSLLPDDPSVTSYLLFQPGPYQFVARVGKPYGEVLGNDFLYDKAGNKLVDPSTGLYLRTEGYVPIGNITPDFTGGMTNAFSWKNWSLNVFIDFRRGGDIWSNTNAAETYGGLGTWTARGDERENGVVNPGSVAVLDGAGLPVPNGDGTYQSTGAANATAADYKGSRFPNSGYYIAKAALFDGSFIKLREVSLGWALPKKWLSGAGIGSAQLSLVGRNVAILFKNLPGLDPDMAVSSSNKQGNEGGAVPATRSLGANLNVHF